MNLANQLTLLRILLIPFFMFFLLTDGPNFGIYATIIFIAASFTDFLDGYIARSRNLITNFGKFADPLADKLLVTAALLSFIQMGKMQAWVVMVILAREFIVSIFRAVAASSGIVIAASPWGKAKTISQMIAIVIILMNNYPFESMGIPADTIMVNIAVILTIVSGADYIIKNKQVLM